MAERADTMNICLIAGLCALALLAGCAPAGAQDTSAPTVDAAALAFGDLPVVEGILYGIKPAVTAIVAFAAWRIGPRALKNAVHWAIAAAAFVAIFALKVPFPYIVVGAGIIGYIGGRLAPDKFKAGVGHGSADKSYGPALIDDHSAPPVWASFS